MTLPRLLLLGCGKMGRAMLDGWLAAGTVGAVEVVEPVAASVPSDPRVASRRSAGEVGEGPFDALVVAVKPQATGAALPAVAGRVGPGTLVVSIAAGRTIAYFREAFGEAARVVRAMPNTPAAVGRGMTVCAAGPGVADAQRALADRLLGAVGEVAWVEDEDLIDAVTAVSGGGPAYVFLLIEALAEAGRKAGLPAELSMRIARATVVGSGELARLSPHPASRLREDVTSPGGTTRAALDVLMAEPGGVQDLFDRAVAAATRRARELR